MTDIVGRLRTPRLAAAPSSPVVGEVYYDTVTNNLYYWNGSAWTAPGSYVIQDMLLGAATASFDFTSIPQTFRHLVLEYQGRCDVAGALAYSTLRINGVTSGYYVEYMSAAGSGPSAAEVLAASDARCGYSLGTSLAAGLVVCGTIRFQNYTQTLFNKDFTSVSHGMNGTATGQIYVGTFAGFNNSTAAITRITLYPQAGNWIIGSRATLYGLL